jgi:peptide/nickel transport system substrate-binding protein
LVSGQSAGQSFVKTRKEPEMTDRYDSAHDTSVVSETHHEPGTAGLARRSFLRSAALGGTMLAVPGLLTAACSSSSSPSPAQTGGEKPRYGGKLRVAMVGGSVASLDPGLAVAEIESARATNLFDRLVNLHPDMGLEMDLAESMEPNADASVWTVRLRPGVEWHDGSPFTADDVIFSFQRMGAPKSTLFGASVMALVDLPGLKKLDRLTVQIPLKNPISEFPVLFITPQMQITKNGQTDFSHPIGTGPFKFVSFSPGRQSVFARNPHYWQSGHPYVDELVMIDTSDPTARLNALLGGQVDAMDELTYPDAKAQQKAGNIRVLAAQGSAMVPIYMATDMEPFTDVRVRQAMRLIAGRPQLIQTALDGTGTVGNDLYGHGLPDYASQLPQRHQDIAQAKSLLKAAGKSGLTITLPSSTAAPGMLESATAFAQQARAAGVTINVNNGPAGSYFGTQYLKQNIAQTQWLTTPMYNWIGQALAPTAPFNETHWHNPQWDSLLRQAEATIDSGKRQELYFEMQKILWNEGGYIIWGFYPLLDGVSLKVRGAIPNPANELGNWQFQTWWFSG